MDTGQTYYDRFIVMALVKCKQCKKKAVVFNDSIPYCVDCYRDSKKWTTKKNTKN